MEWHARLIYRKGGIHGEAISKQNGTCAARELSAKTVKAPLTGATMAGAMSQSFFHVVINCCLDTLANSQC